MFFHYNFFQGGCPNATVTAATNPNAAADPDGTPLRPKPGDQIAQLVLTETGNGPGGQTPTIGVTVTFIDPLPGPLKITKIATHDPLKAQPLKSTRAHLSFIYSIEVVNPGPFPARVRLTDQLPDAFTVIGKPATSGGTCAITRHELSCDSDIPPGKARLYAVHGRIDRAGMFVNTATATATADGLRLRPVSAEASLKVT